MDGAARSKTRLETWKEVAAFFGRTERTVKRWESQRGLPVHRMPGESRSRVFADVAELKAWIDGAGAFAAETDLANGSPGAASIMIRLGRMLTALAMLLAVGWFAWSAGRLSRGDGAQSVHRRPPPLEAQRLYLSGMDDWRLRTPDSLSRAVNEFNGAIRLDPDYAEAYVGLALTYNLLREYTLMPASQAYPLAKAAAEHALSLDDTLPQAHASLAFVDFFGFWDTAAARREYEKAIALDDKSATAHHWFATFLLAQPDLAGARREIDKALALDPSSRSIQADRGLILFTGGQADEGVAILKGLEASDPAFLSPHSYLSQIHFARGPDGEYVREEDAVARLKGDPQRLALVAAARAGLAAGGPKGLLRGLLAEQIRQFRTGSGQAYPVGVTCARLGDTGQALTWLQLAVSRREEQVVYMRADNNLASLRRLAGFSAILAQIRPA